MSGKIPHMRMHVASDAAPLGQLLETVWTKYSAMSWSDKAAAEVEFIEQSKEYIPYGSDFFMARVSTPRCTEYRGPSSTHHVFAAHMERPRRERL